jgi:hypothetical protein
MLPFRYRRNVLRNDIQQVDVAFWFDGFRRGAEVARAEGWRERIMIPIGAPPASPATGYRQETVALPWHQLPELPRPRQQPTAISNPAPPPAAPVPPPEVTERSTSPVAPQIPIITRRRPRDLLQTLQGAGNDDHGEIGYTNEPVNSER